MNLSSRLSGLRGQMLIAFALRGASAAFSFALNWLIAYQFGAEGVGNFAVALTTAVISSTLALAGAEYVLVRTVALELDSGRSGVARTAVLSALRQSLLFATVIAAVLFFGRELIAEVALTEPGVAPFLGILAVAIPLLAAGKLLSSALRGAGHIAMSQSIDGPIGTGLAALALAIAILVGLAWSPLLPPLLYVIFVGVSATAGWMVLSRRMRDWAPRQPLPESLLWMGLPILCVTISNLFVDWFATLLLSAEAGPAAAGVFRVAFQIVTTLNLLMVSFEAVLGPVIAVSHAAADKARIASVSRQTVGGLLLFASPLLLAILLAPEWLMELFGDEFRSGAAALQVLALGQFVAVLTGPVGVILLMTRHERWSLGYAVAGAIIAAALCAWLIPAYGLMGAAIAVTATTIFRRLAALLIVRQVVGIRFFARVQS